jgi:choline dehydrogenase
LSSDSDDRWKENKVSIQGSLDDVGPTFANHVRLNQRRLRSEIKSQYDFIVCGSGAAGLVVARRLAENPEVAVLMIDAGGDHGEPEMIEELKGSRPIEKEPWVDLSTPLRLNGRAKPLNPGSAHCGEAYANSLLWARGHKNDWDSLAADAGDKAWNYDSILAIYRRIEDWRGAQDSLRRGTGGIVFIQPAPDPNPIAPAMIEAACSFGVQRFDDANGRVMEEDGGAAVNNLRIRDGRRLSVFGDYLYPVMDRPNLTVLPCADVLRIIFEGKRALGVEVLYGGLIRGIRASVEIVLSLGAINTPTLLMQSGVGDEAELKQFGIPVVQHLPGVGKNVRDHVLAPGCIWQYREPLAPRNNGAEASFFWKSDHRLEAPDVLVMQAEFPLMTEINASENASWSLRAGLVRPLRRGRIRLTGPNPADPVQLDANRLEDPADLKAMLEAVHFCREIGNSEALRPFAGREIMPGSLKGAELEFFIRAGIVAGRRQTGSAKMGRDKLSVVDGDLRVYGIKNLRIADRSILPSLTAGDATAPSVVIGERAAELLRTDYKL